jgi:hypothetical protein
MSHGRHPAEWDRFAIGWIEDERRAAEPYACATKTALMPRRPREVLCELLAVGVPVHSCAHHALQGLENAKSLVKRSRKVLSALRSAKAAPVHVEAARMVSALSPAHADFISFALNKGGLAAVRSILRPYLF